MWIATAEGPADQIDAAARAKGMLFPGKADILQVEITTATRVAERIAERDVDKDMMFTKAHELRRQRWGLSAWKAGTCAARSGCGFARQYTGGSRNRLAATMARWADVVRRLCWQAAGVIADPLHRRSVRR